MATAMALNISIFRTPRPIQSKRRRRLMVPVSAIPLSNGQTREREKMKKLFKEARERCIRDPMDGVSFSVEEFHRALDECGFGSHIGSKVKGTILMTYDDGAFVDIMLESSAFLPLQEACIHKINHISEAGIYPGSQEEFVVIGENATDGSLILSLRLIQYDLAWERCQQLFEDDAVVKGKVVGENKGGAVVNVEGLHGFVPFSQIHKKSTAQELLDMELPLKFVMVDRKGAQLILSNCKAIVKTREQMEIGSVVTGTVCSVKPYGVLVDIGGVTGLLHISQISHDHISDIAAVLQPGDILKVMILSRDYEKERVSLSTKRLEPTPGDMIHNPKLVFEKAEEMAETFKQRLTWVEEVASAEMLRSHPEP